MEKYPNTSLYADCPSHVYDYGRQPPWAFMPPILRAWLLTSLSVLWRLQTPRTRLRGVAPLTDGETPGTWRGKRTRRVYSEGMLLWVWPGCCSQVSLYADLIQPGGEVHGSKPVRGKSKG